MMCLIPPSLPLLPLLSPSLPPVEDRDWREGEEKKEGKGGGKEREENQSVGDTFKETFACFYCQAECLSWDSH